MCFVSNIQRISAKEMEELRKDLARAAGDAGWGDCWRSQETVTVQPGKYFQWRGEEGGKSQRKEIWRISWAREDIARNLEVVAANTDEDLRLKQLGDQSRNW